MVNFKKIYGNNAGETPSSGRDLVDNFNENFRLVNAELGQVISNSIFLEWTDIREQPFAELSFIGLDIDKKYTLVSFGCKISTGGVVIAIAPIDGSTPNIVFTKETASMEGNIVKDNIEVYFRLSKAYPDNYILSSISENIISRNCFVENRFSVKESIFRIAKSNIFSFFENNKSPLLSDLKLYGFDPTKEWEIVSLGYRISSGGIVINIRDYNNISDTIYRFIKESDELEGEIILNDKRLYYKFYQRPEDGFIYSSSNGRNKLSIFCFTESILVADIGNVNEALSELKMDVEKNINYISEYERVIALKDLNKRLNRKTSQLTDSTASVGVTDFIHVTPTDTIIISAIYYHDTNTNNLGFQLYDSNYNPIADNLDVDIKNYSYSNAIEGTSGSILYTDVTIPLSLFDKPDIAYIRAQDWSTFASYIPDYHFYLDTSKDVIPLGTKVRELDGKVNELLDGTIGSNTDYDKILSIIELPGKTEYDLFVFAGQSNMMGASALKPDSKKESFYALEYKYKKRLLGEAVGEFVNAHNSAGEWIYKNPSTAWGDTYLDRSTGNSNLTNYANNCYFVSACSNAKNDGTTGTDDFSVYSENSYQMAASLPPYLCREYNQYGHPCVYAHIAKGSTRIEYYFNDEMTNRYDGLLANYNQNNGTNYDRTHWKADKNASAAFDAKVKAMIQDFGNLMPDKRIRSKSFLWHQGESNASATNGVDSKAEYKLKLQVLWAHLQELGFEYFLCIRVGYFGNPAIKEIMAAQEEFCNENENCYMITRAISFMYYSGQNTANWFINLPGEEYMNCRDSYFGYNNQHINEKGFELAGKRAAINMHRVLHLGLAPDLEKENIIDL